jgi:hypothetical protein
MARSNSPRTHVRTHVNDVLRAVKSNVTHLQQLWTSRSTVFVPFTDDDGRRNHRQDPRPAADYAENSPEGLNATIAAIADMIQGLQTLRGQLIDTYYEVAEEQKP